MRIDYILFFLNFIKIQNILGRKVFFLFDFSIRNLTLYFLNYFIFTFITSTSSILLFIFLYWLIYMQVIYL